MITPSDQQWEAIRAIVAWYTDPAAKQVFYLAGYAGTGKSTVYQFVREELAHHGAHQIVTCAYTGKAAHVLRKKGTSSAMTIHGAIYSVEEDEKTGKIYWTKNPLGPAARADLIGLDECSMVNDDMAEDLVSFGKRILVMGDPGQLPPINGLGAFTKQKPDFFLHEVHRQAAESPILRLATMARKGERIPTGDYGAGVRVLHLTSDTAELAFREGTQTLCGTKISKSKITAEIRKRRGFGGRRPQVGERLLCVKNDRELRIYNGQMGICTEVRERMSGTIALSADLEDRQFPLQQEPATMFHFDCHFDPDTPFPKEARGQVQFDWGWVLTCHKAQGSEWPNVTIVDDSAMFREDRHRWAYTAITRASEGLTLLQRAA
jgi:exodeoxyribonuclease-5